MNLKINNQAESPIEVVIVVMVTILIMSLVVLTLGPFVDEFMATLNAVDIPLDTWGQDMMALLPVKFASWFFIIPGFMVLMMMVWGIKTVIKKHQYSKQDVQYMSDEF